MPANDLLNATKSIENGSENSIKRSITKQAVLERYGHFMTKNQEVIFIDVRF